MFFINSNDNAKLAVYELNPNGKKTIVLIHGWPLSHKMYEYQIPTLLNADYRIITMDIRGFGNDVFDDLKYINTETGIFHGKNDKICPFGMAEIMHNNIRNSILFPIEKAGHGAFYEARDPFNKNLIHFLNNANTL